MTRALRNTTVLLGLGLGGCGPGGPQMEDRPVVPTTGRVLVDGKAQPGVVITLFPDDPGQEGKPQAVTDAEGKFRLETYRADGAPAGSYKASAYWPAAPRKGEDADSASPKDRLGRRFADPETSGLRAVVEVPSTEIPPFELK